MRRVSILGPTRAWSCDEELALGGRRQRGVLARLDGRVAFVIAGMFLLSVLRLSHVSPFLYYQF